MAFEVRYVGNRNKNAWTTENWNGEENIFETGFLNEFKLAQANIAANVAGRPRRDLPLLRTRHRHGAAADLPRVLQRRAGVAGAGTAARYTSTNFSNTAWTGHLGAFEAGSAGRGERSAREHHVPGERDHRRARRRTSSS